MEDTELYDNALTEFFIEEHKKDVELKKQWRKNLKGLINVTGLFNGLDENDNWKPIDIVEIYETDEKLSGYSTYQHARIVGDDKLLYMKTNCDEIRGVNHYYVWQTCGMMGDDYSGYLLYPLKNGKYFRVSYSC